MQRPPEPVGTYHEALGNADAVAADGVYEYMADRWGEAPMTPQAGAAAYQRGPSGKLCAARIYDDVEPPASLAQA